MVKKIFCAIALTLCVVGVSAQDSDDKKNVVLVYAGPQLSSASTGGVSAKFSFLGGVQYERNSVFGEGFGLFGGLEYTAKGTKDFTWLDGGKGDFNLNFLQLNLGVKYEREIWGFQGFGQVGPYAAFGIGGKTKFRGIEVKSFESLHAETNGSYITYYDDGGAGFKKFDYGLRFALGAEYKGFRLTLGYQLGLADIADKQFISNGYKNNGFFASLGYGFKF